VIAQSAAKCSKIGGSPAQDFSASDVKIFGTYDNGFGLQFSKCKKTTQRSRAASGTLLLQEVIF
jgi:hypothetical protein